MRTRAMCLLTAVLTAACGGLEPHLVDEVVIDRCILGGPRSLLWYQNEGGAWTSVTPQEGVGSLGSFRFAATRRFAITDGGTVIYLTTDDVEATKCAEVPFPTILNLWSGRYSLRAGEQLFVAHGGIGGGNFFLAPGSTTGTYKYASDRNPFDLFANVRAYHGGNSFTPRAFVLRRNVATPPSESLAVLDFDGPEARSFDTLRVSTNAPGAGQAIVGRTTFHTAQGASVALASLVATSATVALPGVPSPLVLPSESYTLSVSLVESGQNREAQMVVPAASTEETLLVGPGIAPPAFSWKSVAATNLSRFSVDLPRLSEYPTLASVSVTERVHASLRYTISVVMTASYAGDAPVWHLEYPDLSALGCSSSSPRCGLGASPKTWEVEMHDRPRTFYFSYYPGPIEEPVMRRPIRSLTRTGSF